MPYMLNLLNMIHVMMLLLVCALFDLFLSLFQMMASQVIIINEVIILNENSFISA